METLPLFLIMLNYSRIIPHVTIDTNKQEFIRDFISKYNIFTAHCRCFWQNETSCDIKNTCKMNARSRTILWYNVEIRLIISLCNLLCPIKYSVAAQEFYRYWYEWVSAAKVRRAGERIFLSLWKIWIFARLERYERTIKYGTCL